VRDSRHPEVARAFIDLLLGPEGQTVLERLGFRRPPPAAR
jgi:ABC-type Fe3+ transport system substrate-binding protein